MAPKGVLLHHQLTEVCAAAGPTLFSIAPNKAPVGNIWKENSMATRCINGCSLLLTQSVISHSCILVQPQLPQLHP
jgi:hypothetical protein